MQCTECDAKTKVIDSRPTTYGIRRRRTCQGCGHRFSTIEVEVLGSRTYEPEEAGHTQFAQELTGFLDNYHEKGFDFDEK